MDLSISVKIVIQSYTATLNIVKRNSGPHDLAESTTSEGTTTISHSKVDLAVKMLCQSQSCENSRRCLPFVLNDFRLGSVEDLLEAGYPCSHSGMHVAVGNDDALNSVRHSNGFRVNHTHVLLALM